MKKLRRAMCVLLAVALALVCASALAAKARYLRDDSNSGYHASHLWEHIGSGNCKVSGNYIKVRAGAGSGSVLGHVEVADSFILYTVDGKWAQITVTYSAPTSPDSWAGLSGWIDADYLECPCSRYEYYNGPARTTYDMGQISSNSATLRETPTTTARSLAKLSRGSTVEVISLYDGLKGSYTWCRCRYGQQMGYIRSDLIQITVTGLEDYYTSASSGGNYGNNGYSYNGNSGYNGYNGNSGYNGYNGYNGNNGYNGYNGYAAPVYPYANTMEYPRLQFAKFGFEKGQVINVYSAPSLQAWRGANGKASVGTAGSIYCAGQENGWYLIMYENSKRVTRVGYIRGEDLYGPVPDGELQFAFIPCVVQSTANMSDDPAHFYNTITTLQPGTTVYLLADYRRSDMTLAYIEASVNGKPARGFIPLSDLGR